MYSGDVDEEEDAAQPTPTHAPKDSDTEDFLAKLHSLKVDCVQLHQSLEAVLRTSGICKKYTLKSSGGSSRGHRKGTSDGKATGDATGPTKRPKMSSRQESRNAIVEERQLKSIKRYCQRRKELAEKPHLVALRPKVAVVKLPRKHAPPGKTGLRKSARKSLWAPRRTVPVPFRFTVRDETAPIRATYALRFLEQLLAEKDAKEMRETAELRQKFRAKPPPETTYVVKQPFYVGTLKRAKPQESAKSRLSNNRSRSEPALSRSKTPFRAHAVPISTYIRPMSTLDDKRAYERSQRAIDLLLIAREPFGMTEHSIRSHVRHKVRHLASCAEAKPTFQPNITKSVPDFRLLQREFENRLHEARDRRPTTVTEPFRFHEDQVIKHVCANMQVGRGKSVSRKAKAVAVGTRSVSRTSRTTHTAET